MRNAFAAFSIHEAAISAIKCTHALLGGNA